MSILSFLLPVLLCFSSWLCAAQTSRAAAGPVSERLPQVSVQLVQIGVRAYSDGSHIPIWAVMLGDTTGAERIASRYGRFGPYGLNATLWTRADDAPAWVMTTYRRPMNIDEAVDWYKNSEAFISREQGDGSLLPTALGNLSADVINHVDFIIQYDDGSTKAYLYPGTSSTDAEHALAAIGGFAR